MDYDVTRAGLIFILISVVIGIAAINTGNNLLYVVVAALLSAILVSGIASALVLRSLQLDVHLPEHVFAGRPMLARLLLRNTSSWLPSFSVRVVPAKRKNKHRWGWEASTFGWPRNRDYMPDASARHVGWKATARTDALKVREFSREDERKLRIVFDNPAPGVLQPVVYERAVHLAASLGWHFHHEDVEVSFVAPGLEPTEDVFTFLRYLALVEPEEATPVFSRLRASEDYNVIVTALDAAQIPAALLVNSYFLSSAS